MSVESRQALVRPLERSRVCSPPGRATLSSSLQPAPRLSSFQARSCIAWVFAHRGPRALGVLLLYHLEDFVMLLGLQPYHPGVQENAIRLLHSNCAGGSRRIIKAGFCAECAMSTRNFVSASACPFGQSGLPSTTWTNHPMTTRFAARLGYQ
jgi:hypothetical protein